MLKEAADEELVGAIRRVMAGGSYLDPALGAAVAAQPAVPHRSGDDLTDRELEVLRMIALGNTNAQIAELLCISVRTVESHRGHIQAKTGRSTRAELVAYALDAGLLDEYGKPAGTPVTTAHGNPPRMPETLPLGSPTATAADRAGRGHPLPRASH